MRGDGREYAAVAILKTAGLAGLAALALGAGAAAIGTWGARRDAARTGGVWAELSGTSPAAPDLFDPAMTAELPEIARRYFAAAIQPGTPLHPAVELEMSGSFRLNGRALPMTATQILAPPHGFVWRARIGGRAMWFAGSDGYRAGGASWTRFRLLGLLPVVRLGGTKDHALAAAARMVMESIWAPATLLPRAGAVWRAAAANVAEVAFPRLPGVEPVFLTLDKSGHVTEAVTRRWSDANPRKAYCLQPFGGRFSAQERHQGFTIPTEVEIGNHFGTESYDRFFSAQLTNVRFIGETA